MHEWIGKVNKIGFQFHTPFIKGDPLWLPHMEKNVAKWSSQTYCAKREISGLCGQWSTSNYCQLMKGNWGGVGTTPATVSFLGHTLVGSHGKGEAPCCIGSADGDALKPICEDCGLGYYSYLWRRALRVPERNVCFLTAICLHEKLLIWQRYGLHGQAGVTLASNSLDRISHMIGRFHLSSRRQTDSKRGHYNLMLGPQNNAVLF